MQGKRPLAVVTMVYNESFMLPFWLKHYEIQVGAQNCFIIDHGSDDDSTKNISAQVLRLPRSTHDEHGRAEACSNICAGLLYFYNRVIYCDVDEIMIVDPNFAPTLSEYAAMPDVPPIITAIGMDLLHDEVSEGPLRIEEPILKQRSMARALTTLCKPTFIANPVCWEAGFHACPELSEFHHLYMFHIAYADFGEIARRQSKRNSVAFACLNGAHHSITPEDMLAHVRKDYIIPDVVRVDLDHEDPKLREFLSRAQPANGIGRGPHYQENVLWRIPKRFQDAVTYPHISRPRSFWRTLLGEGHRSPLRTPI